MRIIHTADIHLDRSCAAMGLPPSRGNEIRAHLQLVLQKVLQRAAEWPADAVAITGDLLEHDRATRSTINFLRDALAGLDPIPVFICPGRHDPCQPGSPYLTEPWARNVHIFTTPVWRSVNVAHVPLTIHGFGWDRPDYSGDLPAPLELPEDGRVHCAFGYGMSQHILHGAALEPARFGVPIPLPSGLSYLGLGELHNTRAIEGHCATPIWYAGAPEGHTFDDGGPHTFLEIEITEGAGASGEPAVLVAPRTVSEGRFQSIALDCTGLSSGQELLDAARRELASSARGRLVRLTLEGGLLRQIYDEFDGIRDVLADEAGYVQWRDTCQVAEDYDAIAKEPTSLGAFIARIGAEIQDAPTHAVRLLRTRSRDLGLCAYRNTTLPVRGLTGEYR